MSEKIFEKSLEIKSTEIFNISQIVGDWWKKTVSESKTAASPGKCYAVGSYLVPLIKNSLGDGKSDGRVTAFFDEEKIKITVEDFGSDQKEVKLNVAGDYGMKEAIEYFDVFTVESGGRVYEKNLKNMLEEVDNSDLYKGSKVVIIKYHVKPADEFEEEYNVKRNFSERM